MTKSRSRQVFELEVVEIVEQIKPILAGKNPGMQSAVLAECLSLWLAGWPKRARDDLLKGHLKLVAELLPVNAKILGTEP